MDLKDNKNNNNAKLFTELLLIMCNIVLIYLIETNCSNYLISILSQQCTQPVTKSNKIIILGHMVWQCLAEGYKKEWCAEVVSIKENKK